jgi:hypothetical protein
MESSICFSLLDLTIESGRKGLTVLGSIGFKTLWSVACVLSCWAYAPKQQNKVNKQQKTVKRIIMGIAFYCAAKLPE